jgi:hypothetical protein
MRTIVALTVMALLAAPAARAGEGKSAAAERLEKLKALAGTWTGKAGPTGAAATQDTTVTWKVTGGGSAVVETIDPGTPHEMITVYHLDGPNLVLTHYCAAGNQPTMRAATSGDPRTIAFDFVSGTNMKSADMHMHSARITFAGEDRIDTEWTSWQGGKPAHAMKFVLARQKQ